MARNSIGQFIAALRKAKGMTQQEIADLLNVSNKAVSRWERDECAPDISLIPALAEILEVTCDELLKGERSSGMVQSDTGSRATDKLIKTILSRCIAKFQTLIWISLAVSVIGFVCMLGVSYAFYRPMIGFFIMALFEVSSVLITVIAIHKLKENEHGNELFEAASMDIKENYYKAISKFSYISFFCTLCAVTFSVPLVSFNTSFVYSVLNFDQYIQLIALSVPLLLCVLLFTKKPFDCFITGKKISNSSTPEAEVIKRLNLIQITACVLSSLIFIITPSFVTSKENEDIVLNIGNIIGLVLLVANIVCFIVFFIKKNKLRKEISLPGIRNILLCVPVIIISNTSYVGFYTSAGSTVHQRYFGYNINSLVFGLVLAASLFVIFKLISIVTESRMTKNKN